jgi:hypothetical protein
VLKQLLCATVLVTVAACGASGVDESELGLQQEALRQQSVAGSSAPTLAPKKVVKSPPVVVKPVKPAPVPCPTCSGTLKVAFGAAATPSPVVRYFQSNPAQLGAGTIQPSGYSGSRSLTRMAFQLSGTNIGIGTADLVVKDLQGATVRVNASATQGSAAWVLDFALQIPLICGHKYTFWLENVKLSNRGPDIGAAASASSLSVTLSQLVAGTAGQFCDPLPATGISGGTVPVYTHCGAGLITDNAGQCVPVDPCALVTCGSGQYCSAGECLCQPITVPGCLATACTATGGQCTACQAGSYLSGNQCVACATVPHCTSTLTCTTGSNSQCLTCEAGYDAEAGACALNAAGRYCSLPPVSAGGIGYDVPSNERTSPGTTATECCLTCYNSPTACAAWRFNGVNCVITHPPVLGPAGECVAPIEVTIHAGPGVANVSLCSTTGSPAAAAQSSVVPTVLQ